MFFSTQSLLIQLYVFIGFIGLFSFQYFSIKLDNKYLDLISATIVFIISIVVSFFQRTTGNVFMSNFVLAFAMISSIFILRFVKLSILDYSVLFSIFMLTDILIGRLDIFAGKMIYVFVIFLAILLVYKNRLKILKGNIFNTWFTFIFLIFESYFFELILDNFVRLKIGYVFESQTIKLIIWLIAALITVALSLGGIYVLKKLFNNYFFEINEMGKKYTAIEKYFIYISMSILIFIMIIHFGYVMMNGYYNSVSLLLNIFSMFLLVMQLLYLTLLFRVTYLKDYLYNKEIENQNLALYSANLEKNIDNIKDIKHDIKNIFFTMGQFVEESGNEAMKLFYKTKIYPFAADEILKNDLYGKLTTINNEQLRAFLYYKISQLLERNINMEFEIDIKCETFSIMIDFIDLIRILGILIDNAIEECVNIQNSKIYIKISQNSTLSSYTIKNTVDSLKKESGIKVGVSTKGKNRGNGLVIVQNTIKKYDFIMLNTYFKEDLFVQNLSIYSKP